MCRWRGTHCCIGGWTTIELNRSDRRSLIIGAALVVLGVGARLGFAPGESEVIWTPAPASSAGRSPSLGELREAVAAGLRAEAVAARPLEDHERIDPNSATVEELRRLPGIGPARATAIVADREEHGGYRSTGDLTRVPGIGSGLARRLEPHVALERGASRARKRSGVPAGPVPPQVVNLNRASKDELQGLPGIGPARADSILAYRHRHGRFRSLQDLLAVSGIGPQIILRIEDRVSFR